MTISNNKQKIVELRTDRLLLRQWRKEDFIPFAKMCADPDVMKYYPNVLTKGESDTLAEKIMALMSKNGWGFWAVEDKADQKFIGFVGLNEPDYELPVKPCIEIGWRLAKDYWGRGYATEAAQRCLAFAFKELKLNNVYSFASVGNEKSWKVMQRIGMTNTGKNFEHPHIPEGHNLREHVLYKISKE